MEIEGADALLHLTNRSPPLHTPTPLGLTTLNGMNDCMYTSGLESLILFRRQGLCRGLILPRLSRACVSVRSRFGGEVVLATAFHHRALYAFHANNGSVRSTHWIGTGLELHPSLAQHRIAVEMGSMGDSRCAPTEWPGVLKCPV